ncbi:transmembrane protein 134-like isoform X1 [Stylophora pistillata]|uniref:transmembrane protein 134-like isoform X1 n=1 Tax=Stylophora pistillata TaxID=50429 RepID=UPI000C04A33C|nr:transmembrane protein 134-like isoform X1 [Stylophora pistillata]
MASNVPYSKQNELVNSSSEDLDNEEDADIALRTKKIKKGRIPRPIEPNVQVQNDQDYTGKSGEVSEDKDLGYGDIWSANKFQASSGSFGASSERRKTASVGASSLEFDSQEDVSNFKKETLFWLRHPRIKENWKTVTAAFLLFVAGIAFLLAGIILAVTREDGMKSVIFFVCAAICILPGGYHIIYIYRATKGQRGYNFESIPSFQ